MLSTPTWTTRRGPARLVGVVRAAAWGDSGVDLFFVLSGFLITSLLIQDREGPRYYQDFYWKRALRILPLYFVCLLVMLAVHHNVGAVVLAMLFLANFSNVFHMEAFGPFWTLAIEEQFYLLWPTIIRRQRRHRILFWALFLGFAPIALRALFAARGHSNYHLSFLRTDGLAFGAVLAYRHRTMDWTGSKLRQELRVLTALLLGGLLLLVASVQLAHHAHAQAWAADLRQTGVMLVTGALVGLVIDRQGGPALAFLRSRVLIFLGLISYALYMVHDGVLDVYDARFGQPAPGHTGALLLRFAVALGVTLVLCLLSRYVIELPAMSLRKYVLKRPNPTAEVEDPPLPLARM